jgi:hypothetical protein
MFLVIGEHNREILSVGQGETIEAAIEDWARQFHERTNQFAEFYEWQPQVFEAELMKVKINYSVEICE